MLKRLKQKHRLQKVKANLILLLKRLLFGVVFVLCALAILQSVDSEIEKSYLATPAALVDIPAEEEMAAALPELEATEQEYQVEIFEDAVINETEVMRQNIADIVKQDISFNVNAPTEAMFAELERLDMLEGLYEEELPNDIIEAETPDPKLIHINNKKIKDIKIEIGKKPPYFGKQPVIAIVIDDMGISVKRTADIASLQAPITASFLTYAHHLQQQVDKAHLSGQEIMIHVPMEPQKHIDVAPDMLTTQMSGEEIKQNLQMMLDKFENVKGINNHMGSKLTEDEERMMAVMEVLKDKGLFFLDSKTSAKSRAESAAKKSKVDYAHRHVFLDNENDFNYIIGQLHLTEKLARKNGYAIAIGHPKSQTFAALKEWVPTLDKQKIKLVHLSEIVKTLNPNHYSALK